MTELPLEFLAMRFAGAFNDFMFLRMKTDPAVFAVRPRAPGVMTSLVEDGRFTVCMIWNPSLIYPMDLAAKLMPILKDHGFGMFAETRMTIDATKLLSAILPEQPFHKSQGAL